VSIDLVSLRRHAEAALLGAAPAHDFLHVLRVVRNAERILAGEHNASVSRDVVLASAMLHELFNYPKNHPDSAKSGDVCGERAEALLLREGADRTFARAVRETIAAHAFSKGQAPPSVEAAILQDADRLDAIGAIGIARCMATTSEMARPFYNPDDAFCGEREPNDKLWGIDHFYKKLLKIPGRMNTATGRALAEQRTRVMTRYLEDLRAELE
jgi:uncharacterized protein